MPDLVANRMGYAVWATTTGHARLDCLVYFLSEELLEYGRLDQNKLKIT